MWTVTKSKYGYTFFGLDEHRAWQDRLWLARITSGRCMLSRQHRAWRAMEIICDINRALGAKTCPVWMASRAHRLQVWLFREIGASPLQTLLDINQALKWRHDEAAHALSLADKDKAWMREEYLKLHEKHEALKRARVTTRDMFQPAGGGS